MSDTAGKTFTFDIFKDYTYDGEYLMAWRGKMRAAQINDRVLNSVFGDVMDVPFSEVNWLVNEPYGLESYQ